MNVSLITSPHNSIGERPIAGCLGVDGPVSSSTAEGRRWGGTAEPLNGPVETDGGE